MRRKIANNGYIFYSSLKRALSYYLPLISFVVTLPAIVNYQQNFTIFFPYAFSFFLIFALATAAAIKPRLRLNDINLTIFFSRRSHINNIYLDEIHYIKNHKSTLVIFNQNGSHVILPKLSKRDQYFLLERLHDHNIEITAVV